MERFTCFEHHRTLSSRYRPEIAVKIAAAGAVPRAVALLQHSETSVVRASIGAVCNLAAHNDEVKMLLSRQGVIPPVVQLLDHPATDLMERAAKTLRQAF